MTRPFILLALAAGLLLAGGGAVSALPSSPTPADDSHRAGRWLIEHVSEQDGGRIVRMVRSRDGHRLTYHVAFWRGNAGPLSGVTVEQSGRTCASRSWRREPGGDVWRMERDAGAAAGTARARLAEALAECGRRPGQAEAALAGFERAFLLAWAKAEIARLFTLAEAEAIANEGRAPEPGGEEGPPPPDEPE